MKPGFDTRARLVNAVLAAIVAVFFFGHAFMGSTSLSFPDLIGHDAPVVLITFFMALVAAHIAGSVVTTYCMLTDTVRPPSAAKKQHQLLKWVTGGLLLALASAHALGLDIALAEAASPIAQRAFLVIVLVILAWHAYVGSKSIARDLRLPQSAKIALRVGIAAAAVVVAAVALCGLL